RGSLMQQRRLRLGDILDDYCPRERRITNHAIVAMIDDEVKQTRCTTCDADHEYKQARLPAPRRKKDGAIASVPVGDLSDDQQNVDTASSPVAEEMTDVSLEVEASAEAESNAPITEEQEPATAANEDDGPVHRRLIRATLPRPEGQPPERKTPEFTIRQPG